MKKIMRVVLGSELDIGGDIQMVFTLRHLTKKIKKPIIIGYITKEGGAAFIMRIPPLSRNCDREDSVIQKRFRRFKPLGKKPGKADGFA